MGGKIKLKVKLKYVSEPCHHYILLVECLCLNYITDVSLLSIIRKNKAKSELSLFSTLSFQELPSWLCLPMQAVRLLSEAS